MPGQLFGFITLASIVSDLDGTLIDSARDIQTVANVVLAKRSIEPVSLEETRSFIGEGTPRLIEKLRHSRLIPDNSQALMLEEFMQIYPTAVNQTVTYEGVADVLQQLRFYGHRLGICTNKPYEPTISVLQHLELIEMFDVIIGGDTCVERKPHPMPLLEAFAALPSGKRIYVGDSHTDAKAAEAANIPFMLFVEGYTNAETNSFSYEASFKNFSDLPELVNLVSK